MSRCLQQGATTASQTRVKVGGVGYGVYWCVWCVLVFVGTWC